ncbi:MAG: carboxypeptidase regulatory-like domain-containing protein [Acidobacteria bacterium]|nr:carboxypeptidase regulatory-like domain-containing protein [Acidobacteriota bacterium]
MGGRKGIGINKIKYDSINYSQHFFAIFISASMVCSSFAQKSIGKVKGVIADQTDARVARARVLIENKKLKKKFITNDAGEYEIELPIGIYKISAEVDGCYPSKKKRFRLKLNQTVQFNFTPTCIRNDIDHP